MSLATVKDGMVRAIKEFRTYRFATAVLAEYPAGSGKMFSCSIDSQDNWGKLQSLDSVGLVAYPFVVTTHDERDSHSLVDTADLTTALGAVATAVLAERALAATAIANVLAAPDEAAAQTAADAYGT